MIAYERTLFLPDIHFPDHDPQALAIAEGFARDYHPHHIFLIGDVLDFYALARFPNKDPQKLLSAQAELDMGLDFLSRLRRAHPSASITYVKGNHEQRWENYLRNVAPAMSGLRGMTIPERLELGKLKVKWVGDGVTRHNGIVVKHGNKVRPKAGYSASGEMDATGLSGVSGHTHRLGQVYHRDMSGFTTWCELGCLCKLDPEYAEGQTLDWQHGLGVGLFKKSDARFLVSILPIVGGCLVWDGREFRG